MRVVVITGFSGSGKSTAVKTFEDMGYYVVDNLPVLILRQFFELILQSVEPIGKVALVVDARDKNLAQAPTILRDIEKEKKVPIDILFINASDEVLARRFSETRHRHPLSLQGSVMDGISKERLMLQPLREAANQFLDTSDWSTNDLHKELLRLFDQDQKESSLTITLMSFGFKYGLPQNADVVFDVRFLANPYFQENLREKTGLDHEVSKFVLKQSETEEFLRILFSLFSLTLPRYQKEGRGYLNVCIGCTGGQHRSVAIAEELGKRFKTLGYSASVIHRDI